VERDLAAKHARTLTASHGRELPAREALITGYVLRLARESVPDGCSRERLADAMAVAPDTVAGWETGRRPLTAVRAGQFTRLRSVLACTGTQPALVRMLGVALDADHVLDHARTTASHYEPGDFHPLGAHVHRREVIELIAWPLSGRAPAWLPAPAARRGPVAVTPEVSSAERGIVFDHLRRVSEASAANGSLLRRQALYLQSYDRRPDAAAWMADQHRNTRQRRAGWTAEWPVTRTLAATLVRYGNPAPLVDFSDYGLADELGQIANLNYWAYWVGEVPTIERDDSFMPTRLGRWRGDLVFRHLASRLDAENGVADLGILTLNALLAARPWLLGGDRKLTAGLAETAERVMDDGRMSSSARQALAQVCYGLRLHTR
jgi:hypothetical protein